MVYAIRFDDPNIFAPAKFNTLGTIINIIIPLLTAGAAIFFLATSLMAAFRIMTNGENPEIIKKSQASIVYSLFGLAFVIVSFFIVRLIGRILGVDSILPI
ncbi:MAG: hypothetical protein Q7R95_05690 [bacterium]|nr:hypothetical protein [bacterium]